MAFVLANRVKETTTTTGTGTVTLLGASTGYQSFSAIGNGNTTYYVIAGQTTSEWEVGIGTYTSAGTTLSRTTVLSSSNSGSLVNFSAGTKDVFVSYPASKSVNLDTSGNVSALGTVASGTWNATTLAVAYGGTGATTSAGAPFALKGANSDITSLSGLTTPLSASQGGTGLATTPANGALDIGNGTGFTRTTLTPGTGISITNGSGSISIASTASGGFSNMAVITSTNASYSIPATKIKVSVVGGGGACYTAAGGGGGGAVKILSGLTIGNTLNITIGAGGTFSIPSGQATSGGTTSVASGSQSISTVSATGGGGSFGGGGASGGSGSGGDLNLTGNPGLVADCTTLAIGGSSAIVGRPYGQGAGNAGGGTNGSAGIVIVEY